jgi:hypothetical protein
MSADEYGAIFSKFGKNDWSKICNQVSITFLKAMRRNGFYSQNHDVG